MNTSILVTYASGHAGQAMKVSYARIIELIVTGKQTRKAVRTIAESLNRPHWGDVRSLIHEGLEVQIDFQRSLDYDKHWTKVRESRTGNTFPCAFCMESSAGSEYQTQEIYQAELDAAGRISVELHPHITVPLRINVSSRSLFIGRRESVFNFDHPLQDELTELKDLHTQLTSLDATNGLSDFEITKRIVAINERLDELYRLPLISGEPIALEYRAADAARIEA